MLLGNRVRPITIALTLCAVLGYPGRAHAQTPAFALNGPVANIETVENEVVRYYDSGRHDADVAKVDAHLQAYVDERLKAGVQKPAVVFDIDDTCLSTFAYERAHQFAYDAASWAQWEHADRFPAIAPTLRLARHLAREHISIFFITGRRTADRSATLAELAQAGYPRATALYLRPMDDHAKSVIPFKSGARKRIEAQGYDILASVGDQWSDLRGGYADHVYKLPNPMYLLP
ncbi:MAG TPA: HAD family acid phosphatase [Candidatus Acidoferrales bacterium]|nr:HAD family acid phosphatase [Candidatus Acidoferrales bacterium]HTX57598.1 HAD family acid phosphatase [Candidatus Acidoferrales bacterium]